MVQGTVVLVVMRMILKTKAMNFADDPEAIVPNAIVEIAALPVATMMIVRIKATHQASGVIKAQFLTWQSVIVVHKVAVVQMEGHVSIFDVSNVLVTHTAKV